MLLAILTAGVAVVVLVTYWPALSAKTIFMDDHQYLSQNPLVQNPSLEAAERFLVEVFRPSTVGGYYQPLSMISLMLDHARGGSTNNLRPFHCTSLALHVANTILVIVLLYLLFGQPWPAALAGLLFGLHPLSVESIPWVGERKTVLTAFFALACLILYVWYVRRKRPALYWACVAAYVLALLSKPTSLLLPLLMVLLDWWPLGRGRWRLREKLPLFIIGASFAIVVFVSQASTAAVHIPGGSSMHRVSLVVCHNIIFYLRKILWPAGLSAYYPFPQPLGLSHRAVLAGLIGTCLLVALLLVSLRWTRAVLTGWLFFIGAILPAIGVIGFADAIAADRFAYLPMVGLLLPATGYLSRAWSAPAGVASSRLGRISVALLVAALAILEVRATRRYLECWQDTVTLYRHIVALSPNDASMRNGLSYALYSAGRYDEAIDEGFAALRLKPDYAEAHVNLGIALAEQGRYDDAIEHYREALRLRPSIPEAHINLGYAYFKKGRPDIAAAAFREALLLQPNHIAARHNLAGMLVLQGRLDEAAAEYRTVLRSYPDHAPTHVSLARVLASQGRLSDAALEYREALRIAPGDQAALAGLSALQAGQR